MVLALDFFSPLMLTLAINNVSHEKEARPMPPFRPGMISAWHWDPCFGVVAAAMGYKLMLTDDYPVVFALAVYFSGFRVNSLRSSLKIYLPCDKMPAHMLPIKPGRKLFLPRRLNKMC